MTKNLKIISFIILIISYSVSCTINKKDKLIGTWSTVSMEKSNDSEDSIKVRYFIEFTSDDGIYYLNQSAGENWYFLTTN